MIIQLLVRLLTLLVLCGGATERCLTLEKAWSSLGEVARVEDKPEMSPLPFHIINIYTKSCKSRLMGEFSSNNIYDQDSTMLCSSLCLYAAPVSV